MEEQSRPKAVGRCLFEAGIGESARGANQDVVTVNPARPLKCHHCLELRMRPKRGGRSVVGFGGAEGVWRRERSKRRTVSVWGVSGLARCSDLGRGGEKAELSRSPQCLASAEMRRRGGVQFKDATSGPGYRPRV